MFYETIANRHGLRHDPFKALVVPRPIGWISTVSAAGICNIAPYSFFNAVGESPHFVVFSSSGPKDSLLNIAETGEFVCSLATFPLRFNMNMTSAPVPRGIDEFAIGDLIAAPSRLVKPPRVKESPAALECRHWKTISLPPLAGKPGNSVVFGQVLGVFIDDSVIVDGITGEIHLRPSEDMEAAYVERVRLRARRQQQYLALRDRPCVTKDGEAVTLMLNAGVDLLPEWAQAMLGFDKFSRVRRALVRPGVRLVAPVMRWATASGSPVI